MSLLLLVIAIVTVFFSSFWNSFIAVFNVCQPIFFMAELISSTIRNLVSIWKENERNMKKTAGSDLCMYVCILMCNKIIRKFQGKKITSNYRRRERKKSRKNYDGEEVEALDWVSVKQQFFRHACHGIYQCIYCKAKYLVHSMPYNSNVRVYVCVCAWEYFCSFFSHSKKDWNTFFFHIIRCFL